MLKIFLLIVKESSFDKLRMRKTGIYSHPEPVEGSSFGKLRMRKPEYSFPLPIRQYKRNDKLD